MLNWLTLPFLAEFLSLYGMLIKRRTVEVTNVSTMEVSYPTHITVEAVMTENDKLL